MSTPDPFESKFQLSMERARRVAARLLRYPLGAHTCEDVVSIFIKKELKAGKSEEQILELLNSPGLYRLLANVKNDIFRWETADKRGGDQASISLEELELFLATPADDPESTLIKKEGCAQMDDVLTCLIEKAGLSETQLAILRLDRQGYSSDEVARALHMDVDVVYARRSEAMHKLTIAARHMAGPDL